MIIRSTRQGILCISQPTHAWISGRLARAWGSPPFSAFEPFEEVCLGAEQHDLGWIPWEAAPRLNSATGLPYNFSEMPVLDHLAVWSRGSEWACQISRYAGLLVSMHNRKLCEHFCHPQNNVESEAVSSFLNHQKSLEERLLGSLQKDPQYGDWSADHRVQHNSQLVWIWDAISLNLCMGISETLRIDHVPADAEEITITLTLTPDSLHEVTVSPWPFGVDSLTLQCEGKVLNERFNEETILQERLQEAPDESFAFRLRPTEPTAH